MNESNEQMDMGIEDAPAPRAVEPSHTPSCDTARGAQSHTPSRDTARATRAKQYDTLHNWLFVVDIVIVLALLCALMWRGPNGLSFRLRESIGQLLGGNPWAVTAGYVFVVTCAYALLLLPYSWWKGFYLEHRYELSNQTLLGWLWDEAKLLGLMLVLSVVVFEIFYALLRSAGQWWWLWAAAAWIVLQVILGMLFPVLILPIFYKTVPLDRPDLEERLSSLARAAGVKVLGMFRVDLSEKTRKANAAMAGLGKTKRILLGDTLLTEFSDNEVASVLAHEFGHFYYKHIWKLMVVASVSAVAGMWIADKALRWSAALLHIDASQIASIATAPLLILALFLFGLITMPPANVISRYFERQADRYALDSTGDAQGFISAMERLADQNLANREPHPVIEFLLHSHPSISRRVEFAKRYHMGN